MCYSANIQTLFAKPQPETVYRLKSFVGSVEYEHGMKVRKTIARYESLDGEVMRRVYVSPICSSLATNYDTIPQRITASDSVFAGV